MYHLLLKVFDRTFRVYYNISVTITSYIVLLLCGKMKSVGHIG